MTWTDPMTLVAIAMLAWTVVWSVMTDRKQRKKADKDELQSALTRGSHRMGEIEGRVAKLESAIEHMPSKDQFAELHGDLKSVSTKLSSVEKLVDRIDDWLLNNGSAR